MREAWIAGDSLLIRLATRPNPMAAKQSAACDSARSSDRVLRTCTLETSSASSTPRPCLMSRTPPKVLSPMRAPRARLAWESMKPDAGVMPAPQPTLLALSTVSKQHLQGPKATAVGTQPRASAEAPRSSFTASASAATCRPPLGAQRQSKLSSRKKSVRSRRRRRARAARSVHTGTRSSARNHTKQKTAKQP